MNERERLLTTFLEIELPNPDDFLKIKETLTRIGLTSKNQKVLTQTAHILHKKGRYYIVHFLELFSLDNRNTNFSKEDEQRRNRIAALLQEWGLLKIKHPERFSDMIPLNRLKIINYEEKYDWELRSMYSIGKKFRQQ